MDLEKFRDDIYSITERLAATQTEKNKARLDFVRQRLIELYQKNLVKINHSVLEIICASNLIKYGYTVDVEKPLSDSLVCDVFATKGDGTSIIEIETGFTPPEHALDTVDYYASRITSKIARYSKFCSKFALASPVIGVLPIPKLFFKPPSERTKSETDKLQELCDRYYKNPKIESDDILNSRLHSIYLINIDKGFAKEMDPHTYLEITEKLQEKSEVDF